MSKNNSPESGQDDVEVKLLKLRKAAVAVHKLLFGEAVDSPWRVVIDPDWKALKLPLLRLTAVYGINCEELTKILTKRPKLIPETTPIQDASTWLIGVKHQLPVQLRRASGIVAIQRAIDTGDTEFFIQLGERLRNLKRLSIKPNTEGLLSRTRWLIWYWWWPNPRWNWPGLAYCKHPAQWQFFNIMSPGLSRDLGNNYLDNERRRMGLISARMRFVSTITVASGKLRFR